MLLTPRRALAYGALAVGVLDITDAFVFSFVRRGTSPIAVLQGIAGGLLGRDTASGGLTTAALGLLFHFTIATCVVSVYHVASRRLPVLAERPLLLGPAYGVAVFWAMYYIVLPLSALNASPPYPLPTLVNGLLIHMLGVGLPAALSARAATRVARLAAS